MLEQALREALQGDVHFDAQAKALYATDASNYRQVPIGVVRPQTQEDILRTIELCRQHEAPILSRGAGTSSAGQCCNEAVVMDMSEYMPRILEINPPGRTARVGPRGIMERLAREA